MTTEEVNYFTHGVGHGTSEHPEPHQWRYLGRFAQAYQCIICQLRVSKGDLKANTDA